MYQRLCYAALVILVGVPFCAEAAEQNPAPKQAVRPLEKKSRLAALDARLKTLVAAGKLTEDEARELYALVVGPGANQQKDAQPAIDLEALGRKLKAAVAAGEMTEAEALAKYKQAAAGAGKQKEASGQKKVDLVALRKRLTAAVAAGEMTKAEALAEYRKVADAAGGKGKKTRKAKRKGNNDSFYAIVIGRLKTKDIELGEFTMDVDYVTSIYGDRRLKDTIIGKTVKVKGLSGPWIDKLLLIKRGETLKMRSGTLNGTVLSLSPKATVFERATPFDPDTYPIPPEAFRGFQGVVVGTIESKSDQGYDLTMRVKNVDSTFAGNRATNPKSIEGRLMNMGGFFTNTVFREKFGNLRIGDTIRVGAAHRVPETDGLEVTRILESVEAK
ncbi:MAG: hypothetical protein VX346_15355 [Planctomycetota bacterium]|nr:hypothetical protein [Planctomycetota bacterium]